jgi:hypothetical protein
MSHEIAHFPLDFAAKQSVCGATTREVRPRKSPLARIQISSPAAPSGLRGVSVVKA